MKLNSKTNLFDYLAWRGDITCEQDEFNEIDGMILSRFSYAPFEYVFTPAREKASIKSICNGLLRRKKARESVLTPLDVDLFEAMAHSGRFAKLKVGHYVNIFDDKEQTQFSAMTVEINNSFHVVVYRGTDDTIIGWKESINLGFISPIASQRHALEYLGKIAEMTEGRLVLAGHSKGGNLASYAAAFADEKIQNRITDVYNYDGPGFMDSVLKDKGYQNICDRIHTYVPQGSIVGMLLGHKEKHMVIHSNENFMPMQHSLYTWSILGKEFIMEESTTNQSRYLDSTMKKWMGAMDNAKREQLVECAYSIIAGMDAKTLTDFRNNRFDNISRIINSMKNLDDETKQVLNEGIKLFMKSARECIAISTLK